MLLYVELWNNVLHKRSEIIIIFIIFLQKHANWWWGCGCCAIIFVSLARNNSYLLYKHQVRMNVDLLGGGWWMVHCISTCNAYHSSSELCLSSFLESNTLSPPHMKWILLGNIFLLLSLLLRCVVNIRKWNLFSRHLLSFPLIQKNIYFVHEIWFSIYNCNFAKYLVLEWESRIQFHTEKRTLIVFLFLSKTFLLEISRWPEWAEW